jgi:hypothetical protein
MKPGLLGILYWSYIPLSTSFPVEEKPGFTPWPLEKRALIPIDALTFSGFKGTPLGETKTAQFGVTDPMCRGKLPGDKCWAMDEFTVDVSSQTIKPCNGCT